MSEGSSKTVLFIKQWHEGDPRGLEHLLEHHIPFIRDRVCRKLSPALRSKGETGDYVQNVVVQFLRNTPRFVINDGEHFRALLVRIVENSLCDEYDRFNAKRRAMAKERPLPSETVLRLDSPVTPSDTPSEAAQRHEREAMVRFAMELLDPKERELLVLREWDSRSYNEIGAHFSITPDAARMRYQRALGELEDRIWDLRRGRLGTALEKSKLRGEL